MGKIVFQHYEYSFEEILAGAWSVDDLYEHQVLTFCQLWLSGNDLFKMPTSGSTGEPKDIQILRGQMVSSAAATREFFQIGDKPFLFCCLNTWMIAGKMMLVRAMEWDAEVMVVKPKSNPFLDVKVEKPIDLLAMVPLQVEACLENEISKRHLKACKNLIIGGAPVSEKLRKNIQKESLNAFLTFGMTETVSHFALAKITEEEPLFLCVPNVKVGNDSQGRLWVEAPMAGEKRIQSNDLVRLVNQQSFYWLGRSDFIINSGGIKIQPEALEKVIEQDMAKHFPGSSFYLFGEEDEKLGQKLVLLIEASKDKAIEASALLHQLANRLKKYQVPKIIYLIEEFIKTPSGKINRLETFKLRL